MKILCAHEEVVSIEKLKPHPKNRNRHPITQIELLSKILKDRGWRHPIIVSKRSGFIVAGHGRLEAAKLAGFTEVPVDYQEFDSAAQEYEFLVADNATAVWAELDLHGIKLDLEGMPDFGSELDFLGLKNFSLGPDEGFDPNKEWVGMPEFNQGDKTSFRHVIVHFEKAEHVALFFELIQQKDTGETKSIWFPPQERMDTEAKRYE